jgi:hypothetical protein
MKPLGWALLPLCAVAALAQAQNTVVYRCPGPPVLYTDTLTPAEAKERNCRSIENAPVTVIQGAPPRNVKLPPPVAASGARRADERVDANDQRARDGEARRILEAELKREEERLAELKAEYKDGEPDRLGSERNYQRYLDRVAELKEGIARKEADIAAIKRELAKLPPATPTLQ